MVDLARASVVADRLDAALGGPGYSDLLVISPQEVNFYGSGRTIARLDAAFPGGWRGGELPRRGFWGHAQLANIEAVLDLLADIQVPTTEMPVPTGYS